jgi:hypothetical protein
VGSGDPRDGPVEIGLGDRRCHADQFVQRIGKQKSGDDVLGAVSYRNAGGTASQQRAERADDRLRAAYRLLDPRLVGQLTSDGY